MSSDVAIRVENLGKRYRIGEFDYNKALRQRLYRWAKTPFKWFSSPNGDASAEPAEDNAQPDHIWALRNVSFDVKRGEVVGVIGRNGAGKSTLLKILTRITEPTEGRAEIRGRVASLLEVGTGFHPELTGRENVFLNGAVLGMTREETKRKFDEIVDFSGVEKFLDTPVKRYSSGMRVRLAFAVAAHLEPEILLIDEVLAVGDAEFQRRCIGKMRDVAHHGRTVMFVSHAMATVDQLTSQCILLKGGCIEQSGPTGDIIRQYLSDDGECSHKVMGLGAVPRDGSGLSRVLRSVVVGRNHPQGDSTLRPGDDLVIMLGLQVPEFTRDPRAGIGVEDSLGRRLFTVASQVSQSTLSLPSGKQTLICRIPCVPLAPGRYYLTIGFHSDDGTADHLPRVAAFDVAETNYFGTGRSPAEYAGCFLMKSDWEILEAEG